MKWKANHVFLIFLHLDKITKGSFPESRDLGPARPTQDIHVRREFSRLVELNYSMSHDSSVSALNVNIDLLKIVFIS